MLEREEDRKDRRAEREVGKAEGKGGKERMEGRHRGYRQET